MMLPTKVLLLVMRAFLALLLLSFSHAWAAPSRDTQTSLLTKPVIYRTVAIPLYRALDEISKQAGVKLTVSDELADEPIILVLSSPTTKEVMDHVAAAVGASWKDKGKGEFYLERTAEMEEKLENEIERLRTTRLQQGIDLCVASAKLGEVDSADASARYAKSLAGAIKLFETDPDKYESVAALEPQTPANRALASFLKLIPAEALAPFELGDQVCYSTQPNSLQREIPGDTEAIVAQLTKEQNEFADAFAKEHPASLKDQARAVEHWVSRVNAPIAKVVLSFVFYQDLPGVTMIAIDASGKALLMGTTSLIAEPWSKYFARQGALLASAKNEEQIELSPESQVVRRAKDKAMESQLNPPPLRPEASSLMLDPVRHDPLSFQISDGFFALAEKKEANVVAYVPDEMALTFLSRRPFTLPLFLQGLSDGRVAVHEEGNWIVAVPDDRLSTWRGRCSREMLGKCLQEGDANGYISVASAARLAISERRTGGSVLPGKFSSFGNRYGTYEDRNLRLLRFYSTLTESQLSALESGQSILSNTLNKEQHAFLEDFVYNDLRFDQVTNFNGQPGVALWRIATEVLPEGIPSGTTITMADAAGDSLFVGFEVYGYERSYEIDLDWVARKMAEADARPNDPSVGRVKWLADGKAHNLSFKFAMSTDRHGMARLRESKMAEEKWTMAHLPKDLKDRLDLAVAKAKAELAQEPVKPVDPPVAKPPL